MRVGTAPVGEFIVGDLEWVQRADVALPPPSLDELLARGGGVLDVILRLGEVELPWVSGTVTVEADRTPSRQVTATVEPPLGWTTAQLKAALQPRGPRLVATGTIADPLTGRTWSYPLATVIPAAPSIGLAHAGRVEVSFTCGDPLALAKQAAMSAPYVVATGQRMRDVIADMLSRAVPWLPVEAGLDVGSAPPGAHGGWGVSPVEVADQLARSHSASLRADGDGVTRLHWFTRPGAPVVATWTSAGDSPSLVDVSREVDSDVLPETCLIEYGPDGAHTSWPPDPVPGSITMRAEGDYSWVTDVVMAQQLAFRDLRRAQARRDRVEVVVPADYRRDLGDRVRVIAPQIDLDVTGFITGITWTLGAATMTATIAQEDTW